MLKKSAHQTPKNLAKELYDVSKLSEKILECIRETKSTITSQMSSPSTKRDAKPFFPDGKYFNDQTSVERFIKNIISGEDISIMDSLYILVEASRVIAMENRVGSQVIIENTHDDKKGSTTIINSPNGDFAILDHALYNIERFGTSWFDGTDRIIIINNLYQLNSETGVEFVLASLALKAFAPTRIYLLDNRPDRPLATNSNFLLQLIDKVAHYKFEAKILSLMSSILEILPQAAVINDRILISSMNSSLEGKEEYDLIIGCNVNIAGAKKGFHLDKKVPKQLDFASSPVEPDADAVVLAIMDRINADSVKEEPLEKLLDSTALLFPSKYQIPVPVPYQDERVKESFNDLILKVNSFDGVLTNGPDINRPYSSNFANLITLKRLLKNLLVNGSNAITVEEFLNLLISASHLFARDAKDASPIVEIPKGPVTLLARTKGELPVLYDALFNESKHYTENWFESKDRIILIDGCFLDHSTTCLEFLVALLACKSFAHDRLFIVRGRFESNVSFQKEGHSLYDSFSRLKYKSFNGNFFRIFGSGVNTQVYEQTLLNCVVSMLEYLPIAALVHGSKFISSGWMAPNIKKLAQFKEEFPIPLKDTPATTSYFFCVHEALAEFAPNFAKFGDAAIKEFMTNNHLSLVVLGSISLDNRRLKNGTLINSMFWDPELKHLEVFSGTCPNSTPMTAILLENSEMKTMVLSSEPKVSLDDGLVLLYDSKPSSIF